MPIVIVPDGRKVRFPDTMSREEIKKIIVQKFPDSYQNEGETSLSPQAGKTEGWFDRYKKAFRETHPILSTGYDAVNDVVNSPANTNIGRAEQFSDNASFGLGTKVAGGINGLIGGTADTIAGRIGEALGYDNPINNKSWGENIRNRYNEVVDASSAAQQEYQQERPEEALAVGLSGSLVNPVNIKGAQYMAKGASLVPKIAKSIGVGAATGIADTIGKADSLNDLEKLPENMATGAMINAAFPVAGKVLRPIARGAGSLISEVLGNTTGAGGASVKQAFDAGKRGSKAFRDNMRNSAEMDDIVNQAREGVERLKIAKNAEYENNFNAIKNDKTVLDITPITDKIKLLKKSYNVGGFSKAGKGTQKAIEEIDNIVNDFISKPEAHNVEGFDALKQRLQDITFPLEEREARRIVNIASNEVKKTITKQAPSYAKIMKEYHEAADAIRELEQGLSLGQKKTYDTALRKLQSVFRNNVNSNYGNRASLLKKVEKGNDISDAIAGQSLNSWTPRGLAGQLGAVAGGGAAYGGAINPAFLATFSPRFIGEAAYLGGKAAKGYASLAEALSNSNPAAVYLDIFK